MVYRSNGILFGHKKEKGTVIYPITWVNLKNLMLSDRSRSQRTTTFYGSVNIQNKQIHGDRK